MALMIKRRRSFLGFPLVQNNVSQFALPLRVFEPWKHAFSSRAVLWLRPSRSFQCDGCACQTGAGTTMLLNVAFGNVSEKILSCVWAAPSASHTLCHCCKTNWQCSAGSLQVGLHHQEGLPGDGRSRSELSHHQTERSLSHQQHRVGPAGVGPRGLCHPAAGQASLRPALHPSLCEEAQVKRSHS